VLSDADRLFQYILLAPAGLAITNAGVIYFATADIGGTGHWFHKLDTSSGSISDLGKLQSGGSADKFIRVLLSPDGSRVYSRLKAHPSGSILQTIRSTFPPQREQLWRVQILSISGDGNHCGHRWLFDRSIAQS